MTEEERAALRAYLLEERRHYIALAKAAEVMLASLCPKQEPPVTSGPTVTQTQPTVGYNRR